VCRPEKPTRFAGGTGGSNPLPSAEESISPMNSAAADEEAAFRVRGADWCRRAALLTLDSGAPLTDRQSPRIHRRADHQHGALLAPVILDGGGRWSVGRRYRSWPGAMKRPNGGGEPSRQRSKAVRWRRNTAGFGTHCRRSLLPWIPKDPTRLCGAGIWRKRGKPCVDQFALPECLPSD
jgi:hypothetical protein